MPRRNGNARPRFQPDGRDLDRDKRDRQKPRAKKRRQKWQDIQRQIGQTP